MAEYKSAPLPDLSPIFARCKKPKKAVVTAGMPYANGPVHLGHMAGAHVPADIHARWMRMFIGGENVLFVCGTDDHGSATELGATKAGVSTSEWLDEIHQGQYDVMQRYGISLDVYSGTSRSDCYEEHKGHVQEFLRRMTKNGLLTKKETNQWFDVELNRFLQDRFVNGKCPNPQCENQKAYSDECDECGAKYNPEELQDPISTLSNTKPELRPTTHLWLDMWQVSDLLREWIQSKKSSWRKSVFNEVIFTVLPAFSFDRECEDKYKSFKNDLPKHKSRYAPGKKQVLQFETKNDLTDAQQLFAKEGLKTELVDGWAHRSLTRDVPWGIPVPSDLGEDLAGKTMYVWPESLIAPIGFTQAALKKMGKDPQEYKAYWQDPDAKVYQFLGQDNVYFYVVMQGAMWLASQDDPTHLPKAGDYQMTEVFGHMHLRIDGDKMSKSKGNYYLAKQMLDEKGYQADQIRYFLATLGLAETPSNFTFEALEERNKFLAGPLNASFEKPISACHSKFGGVVPNGELHEKVAKETSKLVQRFVNDMQKANYIVLLGAIENYARLINSMFTQFKPHDDRFPEEERNNALFTCFYVLKNIMIMLYPFAPATMDKLRQSLNLAEEVFNLEELGKPIASGHKIGEQVEFFPPVES